MSQLVGPARFFAWLGNNAVQIDAAEAEAKQRQYTPLLLESDERVELAFKVERDKFYFTTKRLLLRNVKAVTGQKVNYKTVPYTSMMGFSVQTAGEVLDADSELRIWTEMHGLPYLVLNFVKGMVDVFTIQQFLNTRVFGAGGASGSEALDPRPAVPAAAAAREGGTEQFLNWIGDDAKQIDAAAAEAQLKSSPPVLLSDERVHMAFKCGRDSTLFTTRRILIIDVKGWSGKKVEYKSILWNCVQAFAVQTAGEFLDRDAEIRLWTNLPGLREIPQDLRKGKADVMAIQSFIANMVLGTAEAPLVEQAERSCAGAGSGGTQDLLAWMGDDARQIDARLVERQFRPVLQSVEHVEMAFKGRRDLTLFTTKRLLVVDVKGWTGKKVLYKSVPWRAVQAFAVRSAGALLDKDSEMMVWTDIMFEPAVGDDPPQPGMSYLDQDFQKDKVDLMAVHRYLSAKVLAASVGSDIEAATPDEPPSGREGGVEQFLSWLGDDAHQIDAAAVDQQLHTVNPMLQVDERVELALKSGRDMLLFTTKRCLVIDVQGFSGKKVKYLSVPFTNVQAFAVRSAGSFDRDAELALFPRTPWMPCVTQDLRKGRADLIGIQRLLSSKLLVTVGGSASVDVLAPTVDAPGGLDGFLAWLGGDARQINHEEVDSQLHTSPAILQPDERVELALKIGRDMYLFTTKRLLYVDVQGFTGKKVQYTSVPYAHCKAVAVQSAGQLDRDAESAVWTDIPGLPRIAQDLWKGKADMFAMQTYLASKILCE